MAENWRLVRDGNHGASFNMALDEAIMRAHADGRCGPTLRLYGWACPAVSLGYFQRPDDRSLDIQYCRKAGIELVRRPTGGRAVLHGHDLTFSIIIAEDQLPPESRSVLGSHRWLMNGIVAALRNVGLAAHVGGDGRTTRPPRSADCFTHAGACDVLVGSRKVAGSAQARRWGVVLEQGSIPFRRADVQLSRVFLGKYGQNDGISLFPERFKRESLVCAVVRGMREDLGIRLVDGTLLESELFDAEGLAESKFGTEEFTLRAQSAHVFKQRESVPLTAKGKCPFGHQAILVAPMGLPLCRTILVQGVRAGESGFTAGCLLARYTQWQS